jgi:hypothetical protein
MTTTLRSMIHARLGWTWRDCAGTSVITDSSRLEAKVELTDGSGMRQADAVWHAEDALLADGQSIDLELDGLEQTMFGGTVLIRLGQVKALLIVNKNTGAGELQLGGASANAWYEPFAADGDRLRVMPDSPLLLVNCRGGWPVDAQHALLRLTAVGGAVRFDIAILGTLEEGYGSSSGQE